MLPPPIQRTTHFRRLVESEGSYFTSTKPDFSTAFRHFSHLVIIIFVEVGSGLQLHPPHILQNLCPLFNLVLYLAPHPKAGRRHETQPNVNKILRRLDRPLQPIGGHINFPLLIRPFCSTDRRNGIALLSFTPSMYAGWSLTLRRLGSGALKGEVSHDTMSEYLDTLERFKLVRVPTPYF